ncbi:MAG: YCF48-related protein, partial [Bacteroidota bacterium]|nr:YCF48-related protein [Bacteroidota bacterium]
AINWFKAWDSNNWYALGNARTFMKTTNAGASWYFHHNTGNLQDNWFADKCVDAYFKDMNNGILLSNKGILKTTDGGVSFDTVKNLGSGTDFKHLFFLNDNIGYAYGTGTKCRYKTTDGGSTWFDPFPNMWVYQPIMDMYTPNDTLIILLDFSNDIMRSTDGGQSFTVVYTPSAHALVKIAAYSPSVYFVATDDGKVFRSGDAGLSWTVTKNTNSVFNDFYDVKVFGNTVYAAGLADSIYYTSDIGAHWYALDISTSDQHFYPGYYTLGNSNNTLFTAGENGILYSRSGGTNSNITKVHKAGDLYKLCKVPGSNKIVAVGNPSDYTSQDQIIYSNDMGANWSIGKHSTTNTSSVLHDIQMMDAMTGYAIGDSAWIFKTTNGGTDWNALPNNFNHNFCFYKGFFFDSQTWYLFGQPGVADIQEDFYKTTDGGATWTTSFCGNSSMSKYVRSAFFLNPNLGWAVESNNIYKTTDAGLSWTNQLANINSAGGIFMVDSLTGYGYSRNKQVIKTTNGGSTWAILPFTYDMNISSIYFLNANYGIVGGYYGYVAITTDGGNTWERQWVGNDNYIYDIQMLTGQNGNPYVLAAGQHSYIGINNNMPTSVTEKETLTPVNYSLSQNYPNPFNPSTQINYTIPKEGFVKIVIYDVLGRQVSIPVNEHKTAGTYSVEFNGGRLSSGVYYYTLTAGDFVQTKKMLLLK